MVVDVAILTLIHLSADMEYRWESLSQMNTLFMGAKCPQSLAVGDLDKTKESVVTTSSKVKGTPRKNASHHFPAMNISQARQHDDRWHNDQHKIMYGNKIVDMITLNTAQIWHKQGTLQNWTQEISMADKTTINTTSLTKKIDKQSNYENSQIWQHNDTQDSRWTHVQQQIKHTDKKTIITKQIWQHMIYKTID